MDVLLFFIDPILSPGVQPYGLTIIASALEKRGISAKIILPYLTEDPSATVRQACELYQPKILGFSFRNLDTAAFHYTTDGEKTFLKDLSDCVGITRTLNVVRVVGGSGFSIAPNEILAASGADLGFAGASERDFTEFCYRFIKKKQPFDRCVTGLLSVVLPHTAQFNLASSELRESEKLDVASVDFARLTGGTIPVRTKTGCSMKCSYCVVPSIERLTFRPWRDISNEIRLIVDAGMGDRIFIADGEFNLPSEERAIDICEKMYSEFGSSINWTCYLEARYVSPELLKALDKAGCIGISLTVDSYNRETRIGFIKVTRPEVAVRATELCIESGIHTQVNLLFGGPNETIETAISSAGIAKRLNEAGAAMAVTVGLRVYPETPLAIMAAKSKYSRFYTPGKTVKWLGMFCSPIPRGDLAKHIISILPPSETVSYRVDVEGPEGEFYRKLAIASAKFTEKNLVGASEDFRELAQQYPSRQEPQLGLLKCNYELSEND